HPTPEALVRSSRGGVRSKATRLNGGPEDVHTVRTFVSSRAPGVGKLPPSRARAESMRRSTWSPGERPRTTRVDHERPTRAGDPAAGRLVVSRVSRPRGRARGHRVLSRVLHGRG